VTFLIDVEGGKTSALLYRADDAHATLVLAHGAGGRMTHPWMVAVARALSARGIDVVTFNFLYTEARRRLPDRSDVLEATWRAVIAAVRERPDVMHGHVPRRLFIGGKSMGGRIATHVAVGADVDGLVLLGYPLHPPGKPDKLRVAHLPGVKAPMLFIQGSRDVFGTPAELAPFIETLPPGTSLFVVEGGDHSLSVPKRGGETFESVLARVADEIARFTA
jgi:uncharacterized protein